MDNLTHTLTGIAISQTGLNRKTRFATIALILAANGPDIDIVTRFRGTATYLKDHRGLTHSILGIFVLGAVAAGLVYLLGRRARPKPSAPPLNARWLFVGCWIGAGSHLLLDLTNSYGVRPFMPFSGRWCAWDIMPIIDPILLLLLASGLLLPVLFRLVSEEVGGRKPGYRRGATFALAAMVALWGLRGLAHARVMGWLTAHNYGDEALLSAGAFPTALNPFAWTGVVETASAFHILAVDALRGDVDAEHYETYYKPQSSPALKAALESRTGAIFARFARFLWAEVDPTDDGFEVILQDLRFTSPEERVRSFVVVVKLDKNLRVLSQDFHFVGPPRRPR